ncbi:MAG: helix-turn-helix transcriptional regulator [Rhizomicrobium sp.]
MDVRKTLALNLQRVRRERGWSQEQLSFRSGIHRTYVSGLERGIRNPTITVVQKLADTLKVPFGTLLDPPARKQR